jgi:hypothetical protein
VTSWLQSSRLRTIIAAYTINRLGTWFGFIAVSLAVFDHTHSALAVAALLLVGEALPAFVVPALVARVEASPRRRELSQLYFFEAVTTTALAILLFRFWLPAVLLLVALDGTAALVASALLRAAAARTAREEVVPPENDRAEVGEQANADSEADAQAAEGKANAALNVAFSATFMFGPALAGLVVAAAGSPTALFIDAASFLACGVMLIHLHPHVEQTEETSVRARLSAAWTHINRVPALRTLLLAEAVALVFFASGGPIEIVYAKATLQAGDKGYGVLLTVWGVGTVIGSLLFARMPGRRLGTMLTGGTLAVGLAYIGFSVASSFQLACIAAVLGGLGNGVQWASLIGAVQQLTPPTLHGRMMGGVESIGSLSPAIGLAFGGAVTALTSPRSAFLIVGIGAAVMTVAFLRVVSSGIHADGSDANPQGSSPLIGPGGQTSFRADDIERPDSSRDKALSGP